MGNRLQGKKAVVTGAASGMGRQIALDFLKEGAKVVAADIHTARLEELKEEAFSLGYSHELVIVKCDVTIDADCENAVQTCVKEFGECNVLSHNAGIMDDFTPVKDLDNDKWDRELAINLTGSMKIARAALRYFVPNEIAASLVMVTSNGAFQSSTGGPAYCASKAGANALMKSIAYEYGRNEIRCNSICPGPVLSNLTESAPNRNPEGVKLHSGSGYNAHAWEWTGGIIGMPEDISPLAIYLASDESKFVNGASILIDSGVCLSR